MATEHKRSTNGQRKSYFSSGRCRYRSFSRRLRGFMTFSRNRVKKRLWLVVDFSWRHSFSLTPLTLWRQTRAQSHKKVTDENTRLVLDNYSLSSVRLQSVLLITPVAAAGFHCCLWLDTKLWHEMRLARDEEVFFFFHCVPIYRDLLLQLSVLVWLDGMKIRSGLHVSQVVLSISKARERLAGEVSRLQQKTFPEAEPNTLLCCVVLDGVVFPQRYRAVCTVCCSLPIDALRKL